MSRITAIVVLIGASLWTTGAWSQELPDGCGTLVNGYGPFDFRDYGIRQRYLPVVEQYHFTAEVRNLIQGKSSTLIGDIDYTLRAFPNHPGALNAVSRYALRGGKFLADGVQSADCFFERAVAFANDDPVVRVMYGNYLFKRKLKEDAGKQYEEALRLSPGSPEISYNAGLFFLEIGDLERAKQLAKVAYDRDYPLQGLKNKIEVAEASKSKK